MYNEVTLWNTVAIQSPERVTAPENPSSIDRLDDCNRLVNPLAYNCAALSSDSFWRDLGRQRRDMDSPALERSPRLATHLAKLYE
jgi:hypothetical protein